jgi:hypothetical protein
MRTIIQVASMLLIQFAVYGQTAHVAQLEHSLRWQTESNFPNYLDNPHFEKTLISEIDQRLKQRLGCNGVNFPDHFDYRLISLFGKTKVKLPKSSSDDFNVAIASTITRGTTNYKVLLSLKVLIKRDKEVIIEKEVEHELDPYSVSIRLSNQPWLDENEFINIYLYTLEECLGIIKYSPGPFNLGSPEMMKQKVAELMPIEKEYTLAVAGAMMDLANSSYRLIRDSVVVSDFSYKTSGFFDTDFSFSSDQIFAHLFSSITGIDTYYTLKSKEKRTGAIFTNEGEKRKVTLDWLEESMVSTDDDEDMESRIVSPITGRYYDGDSLIAHFICYEQITGMQELSFHNLQFQMGDDDLSESVYSIIGDYKGSKFEVVYREFDKIVLIKMRDKLTAILSLINVNPESLSAGGTRFTKNKTTMIHTNRIIGTPDLKLSTAEWYPLYTLAQVDDEAATEMGYFLLLMFFAVNNAG